jgi:hypothetical protein
MVWIVDDLVEAALGPWGLAVGLGVGLLAAARSRRAATQADDGTAVTATAGGLAGVVAAKNGVVDRIQAALAEAGDSWRDLYAEAHHEWEQSRAGSPGTAAIPVATASGVVVSETIVPTATGKRVRGPNGRYIREEA